MYLKVSLQIFFLNFFEQYNDSRHVAASVLEHLLSLDESPPKIKQTTSVKYTKGR
jgi:hypothetical protein